MSVRTLKPELGLPYFCTFTNASWYPLFEVCIFQDKIYEWFKYLKGQGHEVLAYVIMPNHLHMILHVHESGPMLHKIIGEGKRFMSYGLSAKLKELQRWDLLDALANKVSLYENRKGHKRKFFEDSFDGKAIYTDAFFMQKLNYIHQNPVRKGLSPRPEDFVHSSARFYATGVHSAYEVTHFVLQYFGEEEYATSRAYWFSG